KDGAPAIGKWPGLSCAAIALLMVAALFTGTVYAGSLGIPGELYSKILSLMLGAAFLFSALLAVWLIYRGGRGVDRFAAFSHVLGLSCLAMNVMFACSHMNLRENFLLEIGKSAVVYLAAGAIGMRFAKNYRLDPGRSPE
ncbi:MAG: hypothetical protein LBL37_06590, partial [Gracilibacteraceae bacterium]|nr:hypothetical protein [Gracilibacteraceae bacterium]